MSKLEGDCKISPDEFEQIFATLEFRGTGTIIKEEMVELLQKI